MTSLNQLNKIRKFLSFVLCYKPEIIDLELDNNGGAVLMRYFWVSMGY